MRITASKLYIISECPAAAALPAVREEAGEPALHGSAVHDFIRGVAKLTKEGVELYEARARVLELAGEHREACEAIDVAQLPLDANWMHEVGFAFRPSTGEVAFLGEDLSHDALAEVDDNDRIVGVLDMVGVTRETVTVLDVKTGYRRLPAAVESLQLGFGAVCAAKHFERETAVVGHVFLRHGMKPWWDVGSLDPMSLGGVEGSLVAIHERAVEQRARCEEGEDGAPLDYALGEWCKYCPAKLHCEAQTKLIRAMAGRPVTLEEAVKEKLTPETAAQAIGRLEVLHEAMNRAWAALYAYAEEHPVLMPDGRVLGRHTKKKREWDVEKAAKQLVADVGPERAMAAFSLKPAIKRIEGVAKALVKEDEATARRLLPAPERGEKPKKLSMAGVKDALLARIDAAGGREWKEVEKVDFFRPGENGAEGE